MGTNPRTLVVLYHNPIATHRTLLGGRRHNTPSPTWLFIMIARSIGINRSVHELSVGILRNGGDISRLYIKTRRSIGVLLVSVGMAFLNNI